MRRITPDMSTPLFPSTDRLAQLFAAVLRVDQDPVLRRDFRWFLTLHTGSLQRAITREEVCDLDDLFDDIPLLLPFLPLRLDRDKRVSKSSQKWVRNAIGTASFLEREARYPRDTRLAGSEEGVLGSWLIRQRRAAADQKLDPVHESYLDYAMPTWRDCQAVPPTAEDLSEQWRHLCGSADSEPDSASSWYVQFMSAERNESPSRSQFEALIAELGMTPLLLPVFPVRTRKPKTFTKASRAWGTHALELAEFIQDHGFRPRPPAATGTAFKPSEQRLRHWLTLLSKSTTYDGLHLQRQEFLSVFAPGWRDGKYARRSQEERFEQLATFVSRYGRWPRQNSPDRIERTLALVLSRFRALHSSKGLSPEVLGMLESTFGGNWTNARIPPLISSRYPPPVA